jgi:hypothetical protein
MEEVVAVLVVIELALGFLYRLPRILRLRLVLEVQDQDHLGVILFFLL